MRNRPEDREPAPAPRSTRTIRKILDAARRVFGARGFDATTMDNIADAAVVSKQILYYYYGNKDALYSEVINELIVETHDPVLDFDYSHLDPIGAIAQFFTLCFDINAANDPNLTLDPMLHWGRFAGTAGVAAERGRRMTALLDGLLARGKADGVIRHDADAALVHFHAWVLNVGYVSSRELMSTYLGQDFTSAEATDRWRSYALDALAASLRPAGDPHAIEALPIL